MSQFPLDPQGLSPNSQLLEGIGVGGIGEVLWPLRVALTGRKTSSGPSEIMEILGREEILKRIKYAKEKLTSND